MAGTSRPAGSNPPTETITSIWTKTRSGSATNRVISIGTSRRTVSFPCGTSRSCQDPATRGTFPSIAAHGLRRRRTIPATKWTTRPAARRSHTGTSTRPRRPAIFRRKRPIGSRSQPARTVPTVRPAHPDNRPSRHSHSSGPIRLPCRRQPADRMHHRRRQRRVGLTACLPATRNFG